MDKVAGGRGEQGRGLDCVETNTGEEHDFHSYHDENLLEAFKQEKDMALHFWFDKLGGRSSSLLSELKKQI